MTLSIIVTTLLNTFTSTPDLCADVYVDAAGSPYTDALGQSFSRYCEWTGPDAPVLATDVCCTIDSGVANCSLPNADGRCTSGSTVYCEYGESTSVGSVVCYQPFPSTCDLGFCVDDIAAPNTGPVEGAICCWDEGPCIELSLDETAGCLHNYGYVSWCFNGVEYDDGTIDCFD